METVVINGAQGEGGGQILRSSLTLSLITGKAVRIENIRAGRQKPGLMRQHLTALRAAAEVGAAEVEGDRVGSTEIRFAPGSVSAGRYHFAVGTAGSGTLVLQTVLPALMFADGPSEVTIEGGTHNQWAPPFDFLASVYFPMLQRMGAKVTGELERHGFYPAGGGRFSVGIEPAAEPRGLELLTRGELRSRNATAIVANLPRVIADRELETIAKKLNWPPECLHVCESNHSAGPGNIVLIELEHEQVREVFTGFGRHGARAERVASEAVNHVRDYLAVDAPVGKHLADQLLLPLGIIAWRHGHASRFRTLPLTRHSVTHIEILRTMLGVPISAEADGTGQLVSVG